MTIDTENVPFTYHRGGTSKAVFYHSHDVPPPGKLRDRLLLRLMGSPDPMQIDGMGGTHPVTSKLAVLGPSKRPGVDVDYDFAQASVRSNYISWDGGCGNISSAVGPWAIREGLVDATSGVKKSTTSEHLTKEVKIWMVGLNNLLVAHVPVDGNGKVIEKGDQTIDGVPGTGAPIWMDYKETAGGACQKGLLPSGRPIDHVTVRGKEISVTICDIANIMVFAKASDFGLSGSEPARTLTANNQLIDDVRECRGRASQMIGLCSSWEKVDEEIPNLPYVILLSEVADSDDGDIQGRLFMDNYCHPSMAGTGASCTTACAHIHGTLVNQMARPLQQKLRAFKVSHPLGHLPVQVEVKIGTGIQAGKLPEFSTLSFVRTARQIAKGELSVPQDFDWSDGTNGTNGVLNGH